MYFQIKVHFMQNCNGEKVNDIVGVLKKTMKRFSSY